MYLIYSLNRGRGGWLARQQPRPQGLLVFQYGERGWENNELLFSHTCTFSHRQIEGLDKELNSLTETKESLLSKVN